MDNTQFAMMEDNRPQQRIADQEADNQRVLQNVLQGAQIFGNQANERAKLAQDKQLTMAQMAQNQSQFTALQDLREKEFGLQQNASMSEIALRNSQVDLANQSLKTQQDTFAQQQKQRANQAYMVSVMSDPKASDPDNGTSFIIGKMADAPDPDSFTDADRQSLITTNNLRIANSRAGIANKVNLTNQLSALNEAKMTPGFHAQDYMINKNGSLDDPSNFDMNGVGQFVGKTALAQHMVELKSKQDTELEKARILAASHPGLTGTKLRDVSQQLIAARKDLAKAQNPPFGVKPNPQAISSLQATVDGLQKQQDALYANPPADAASDDAMATPGATGANMQNPSGSAAPAANPAQVWWGTNFGTPSNGQ